MESHQPEWLELTWNCGHDTFADPGSCFMRIAVTSRLENPKVILKSFERLACEWVWGFTFRAVAVAGSGATPNWMPHLCEPLMTVVPRTSQPILCGLVLGFHDEPCFCAHRCANRWDTMISMCSGSRQSNRAWFQSCSDVLGNKTKHDAYLGILN